MGRATSGVTGMKFRRGDELLSMSVIRAGSSEDERYVFTVTDGGFAKRTQVSEYRQQGRGGLGIKAMKLNEDRGSLVGGLVVTDNDEVIAIKASGQITRSAVAEVPVKGRDTMGVKFVGVGTATPWSSSRSIPRQLQRQQSSTSSVEPAAGRRGSRRRTPVPSRSTRRSGRMTVSDGDGRPGGDRRPTGTDPATARTAATARHQRQRQANGWANREELAGDAGGRGAHRSGTAAPARTPAPASPVRPQPSGSANGAPSAGRPQPSADPGRPDSRASVRAVTSRAPRALVGQVGPSRVRRTSPARRPDRRPAAPPPPASERRRVALGAGSDDGQRRPHGRVGRIALRRPRPRSDASAGLGSAAAACSRSSRCVIGSACRSRTRIRTPAQRPTTAPGAAAAGAGRAPVLRPAADHGRDVRSSPVTNPAARPRRRPARRGPPAQLRRPRRRRARAARLPRRRPHAAAEPGDHHRPRRRSRC